MNNEIEISNMIRKMTGLIDKDEIRTEVGNEISKLALIADPQEFKELISRYIRFPDGVEVLRKKWKIVYDSSKQSINLLEVLAQDKDIRLDMLSNISFLLDYGNDINSSDLSKEIAMLEGGSIAIANNFEKLFENCDENIENIVIPMIKSRNGREKFRENFETIKSKFLKRSNIKGFFETIKALEKIEDSKDIYEDYGYWAELYDQIETPKINIHRIQFHKLTQKEWDKIQGDYNAEKVKEEEFIKILNSENREEKKLILQEVANGNSYEYKACGTTSLVIQAGDQVVKFGQYKRKFKVPYHPRIMMPYFRKEYEDDSTLEVFNYGNTESVEIDDEILLKIYKELEEAGIKWGDARKSNLLVLTKDNNLPDFIRSKDFNLFGFLEDSRFPTDNHQALKKGDLVIPDLDMLYAIDDPDYEVGLLDKVIEEYLEENKNVEEEFEY